MPISSPILGLDKVVHFAFYLGLTWLLGQSLKFEVGVASYSFWMVLLVVPVSIGICIEMIQSAVPGRARENMDIVFNVFGTCLGLLPFIKRND